MTFPFIRETFEDREDTWAGFPEMNFYYYLYYTYHHGAFIMY